MIQRKGFGPWIYKMLSIFLLLLTVPIHQSFKYQRLISAIRKDTNRILQPIQHKTRFYLTSPQQSNQATTSTSVPESPRRSRYIPPEMDPEYRRIVVRPQPLPINETTLAVEAERQYPIPSEGDVVQFKGKFGSPGYGKLRFLQYVDTYNTFFLDIIPLKPSKTPAVYIVDRNAKPLFLSINDVLPVKGYYSQRENGYRLAFDNSTDLNSYDAKAVPRASRYRILDKSFELKKKRVNLEVIEKDLRTYDDMKSRIATSSLQIGAVIALSIAFFLPNPDIILSYVLGVLGGWLYFYLLSYKVDSISERYSLLSTIKYSSTSKIPSLTDPIVEYNTTMIKDIPNNIPWEKQIENYIKNRLSSFRFLIPVLIIMIMTFKNFYLDHDYQPRYFDFLPTNQYLGIMGGFLTLRLSLFLNEVVKEFRGEDIIEMVPGSLAIALRKLFEKNKQLLDETISIPRKVVMISGPIAAGRHQLIREIVAMNSTSPSSSSSSDGELVIRKELNNLLAFLPFPIYTDDQSTAQLDPKWYQYANQSSIQQWRQENALFYEGKDRDSYGRLINIFVRNEDLSPIVYKNYEDMTRVDQERKIKKVYCLLGPPSLMENIARLKTIEQQLVWISMSSPQLLQQAATEIIHNQIKATSQNNIKEDESNQKVQQLLDEAKEDVRYYLEKASVIPFVISNNPSTTTTTTVSTTSNPSSIGDPKEQVKQIFRSIKSS